MRPRTQGQARAMTANATHRAIDLMTIGSVLGLLQDEFPDITISKIRFLEAAGLVEPIRTPSGYRKFSPSHVERLRYVLRMQRDHFLPLRVIAEHLDALDRGLQPQAGLDPRPRVPEHVIEIGLDSSNVDRAVRVSRDELAAECGLTAKDVAAIESAGFIQPLADGKHFGVDAVVIARTVGELGRLGLDVRHLATNRRAAAQQFERIEALVSASRRNRAGPAADDIRRRAEHLAALQSRLHAEFLRSSLIGLLEAVPSD